jgi:Domain of unknown function (DUF3291)
MTSTGWHVAQVNIALLRAPIDSPQLADFVALLEPINELADRSPGFVWRLQTEDGDATAIRAFEDDRIIVNMSVLVGASGNRARCGRSPASTDPPEGARGFVDRLHAPRALPAARRERADHARRSLVLSGLTPVSRGP